MGLYKLIIDFQGQSVLRFYRSRTKNFFRGTINYDNLIEAALKDQGKVVDLKATKGRLRTSLPDADAVVFGHSHVRTRQNTHPLLVRLTAASPGAPRSQR